MKIPVVSHFWNTAGVAQWRPIVFPLPPIEKSVKDDYAILQYEKPPTRRYGKYRAILHYASSRDAFNREIVSIKFAFVEDDICSPELESAIRARLERARDDESCLRIYPLFFRIKKSLSATSAQARKLASFGALVICAIILASFLYGRLTKPTDASNAPAIVATKPIAEGKTDSRAIAPVYEAKTPPEPEESPVCKAAKDDNILLKCPRSYLLSICSGSRLPPYRAWREKSDSCVQARRNKFAVGKDIFLESPPEPLASEILKTLFP
ncbi:MAG: hypothetical protein HDQ93_06565 [Desulfovibrio sp.]|nr:hypothetical protein [Desulfovibrio sp.]